MTNLTFQTEQVTIGWKIKTIKSHFPVVYFIEEKIIEHYYSIFVEFILESMFLTYSEIYFRNNLYWKKVHS